MRSIFENKCKDNLNDFKNICTIKYVRDDPKIEAIRAYVE